MLKLLIHNFELEYIFDFFAFMLDVVCNFNCNEDGTIGGICESDTGHGICVCKDNWSGDLCDTCSDPSLYGSFCQIEG